MAWTGGITRATGYVVTAANWNAHLGASGDLDTLFDGTTILSQLVRESSINIGSAPANKKMMIADASQTGGLDWQGDYEEGVSVVLLLT